MRGSQLPRRRQLGAQLADGYRIDSAFNANDHRVLASLVFDHQRFHRVHRLGFLHRPLVCITRRCIEPSTASG